MTRKKVNKKKVNKALLSAVEEGDVEALKSALAAGADVNAADCDDITSLIHAAKTGNEEILKLLIEAGADVNAADCDDITSLMRAAETGNEEILKLLIEAGADVNAADCDDITSLMRAAETGNEEILKLLIEAGADVNVENVYGETALSVAAARGYVSCVEMLKAAGAEGDYEIQQEDEDGDEEDGEEEITVWEGNIRKMWEYDMYLPGDLPRLLNVGKNDRLMFVRTIAQETSNEWSKCDYEYIDISLKREGGEWANICCPKVNDDADPHFPEDWNWQEILDLVWEEKTVTYTTKLNEDYEQVEATWEVEE